MPRFHATIHDLPAGPPPEVLGQVDVAWERARELFDSELELHLADDRPVRAELRRADGFVIEHLSASGLLALACGDAAAELALAG
jgi:hypothetical protein